MNFTIRNLFNNGFEPMRYSFTAKNLDEAIIKFWNIVHKTDARGHNEHIARMELKQGNKVLAMQAFIDGKMA